jgi:hypothetical protein
MAPPARNASRLLGATYAHISRFGFAGNTTPPGGDMGPYVRDDSRRSDLALVQMYQSGHDVLSLLLRLLSSNRGSLVFDYGLSAGGVPSMFWNVSWPIPRFSHRHPLHLLAAAISPEVHSGCKRAYAAGCSPALRRVMAEHARHSLHHRARFRIFDFPAAGTGNGGISIRGAGQEAGDSRLQIKGGFS